MDRKEDGDMKLVVFSENNQLRKHLEDLLTSTPHNFQTLDLPGVLARGKLSGFDGMLVDYQSWQRCISLFKYFGVLDDVNPRPIILFSKGKKAPALKLRNPKALTAHCSIPPQTEDFYAALQQMSASLVPA
jgi:hypothetical protein